MIDASGKGNPEIKNITMDLKTWIDRPAVVVRGAKRRVNTWDQVVGAFANTAGSHLSNSIPVLLEQTRVIQASGMTLGDYLVRSAGFIAELALAEVLPQIGMHVSLRRQRDYKVNDVAIFGMTMSDANDQPSVSVSFYGTPTRPEALLTTELDSRWFTTMYVPEGTNPPTYHLEIITTDAPPTWLNPAT
nr:hypothetical protein [Rhodococcus sp. 15-1154-1]